MVAAASAVFMRATVTGFCTMVSNRFLCHERLSASAFLDEELKYQNREVLGI